MMAKKVAKKSIISIDLADELRRSILGEDLRPGMKLTEALICAKYNVSRTPVREALQMLATEGIVTMIPNRGAFVIEFGTDELKDIFIVRTQYEVQIARWAAQRASQEDLEELDEVMAFQEFYTKNQYVAKVKSLNESFHQTIHNAAHISVLSATIGTLSSIMYISPKTEMYNEDTLDEILVEHGIIVEAIHDRDPKAAAQSMHNHFKNGYQRAFGEEMPE